MERDVLRAIGRWPSKAELQAVVWMLHNRGELEAHRVLTQLAAEMFPAPNEGRELDGQHD